MIHAVINGTGSYLPEKILTNQELESRLDTSHEWIYSRVGIASRHIANPQETTSYMALQASKKALENSNIKADDLDLILVATCTPDCFFPSVACYVQHGLGIKNTIPAMDIAAACSGFIYTLDVAWQYIKAGTAKHVLVIGSEAMSRAVNWEDRASCVVFGDGAGAVILSASEVRGIIASKLHAEYDKEEMLFFPNYIGKTYLPSISMKGKEVFKVAVNLMGSIVDEVLQSSNLTKESIDWLIPHQANIRIIAGIAKKLDLPMSQVIVTIENQGNTSAASIPLALDKAVQDGRIVRGNTLLLESFGAGMTWGAIVLIY